MGGIGFLLMRWGLNKTLFTRSVSLTVFLNVTYTNSNN
jgi:hypothetical protein